MGQGTLLAHGLGFVPGRARGVLRRSVTNPDSDILLLTQDQLGSVSVLPAGILLLDGAPFSHAAIGLLGLGVPTLILPGAQAVALREGVEVLLDGGNGRLWLATGLETVGPPLPAPPVGGDVVSRDGVAVSLRASVRSVAAAQWARAQGSAAIGLVRTEFLEPAGGRAPDADFYHHAFTSLCESAAPLEVTFRLLDIASDKLPAWLPVTPAMRSPLGLQGIRLFGSGPVARVVDGQLTAIGGLSDVGRVRILLPYLTRYEEVHYWVERIRKRLPSAVPIGAMVETPAGALDLERWFEWVDFIAIGCNDLMQCLFAADRDRGELCAYLDPYAPLLYRFFAHMARCAGARLSEVQLCGVLPQLEGVLPLLLGLGYRAFSVDAGQIPWLARTVRATSVMEAADLARAVCAAKETAEVLALLRRPATHAGPFLDGGVHWH
ncbi:MAG: phosphoenolpyruvate-protein phosphotransferase [Gammaproteobacteria bacterium]|nr:phosphoenolpyruvate-protein phosphotransferase [Gammaproteobacteria bacterium]